MSDWLTDLSLPIPESLLTLAPMSDWDRENLHRSPPQYPPVEPPSKEYMESLRKSRRLEAQRLKERLSHIPFYRKQMEVDGEKLWESLAQSYMGY